MNYEDFTEEIRRQVAKKFGDAFSIRLQSNLKNNGIRQTGLVIEKKGEPVSPTFYLNETYEKYKGSKEDIKKLATEIYTLYWQTANCNVPDINAEKISDFNNMKDRIMMRIINHEKNRELLEDVPHKEFMDLDIVYYILFDSDGEEIITALIHNNHLNIWGLTGEQLHTLAMKNTRRALPPTIESLDTVICKMMSEGGIELPNRAELEDTNILILTNKRNYNGSANLLYTDVLEEIAEKMDGNLLILPSSVHEILIAKAEDDVSLDEMNEMVQMINMTEVRGDDVLSDHVYIYNKKEHQLRNTVCVEGVV